MVDPTGLYYIGGWSDEWEGRIEFDSTQVGLSPCDISGHCYIWTPDGDMEVGVDGNVGLNNPSIDLGGGCGPLGLVCGVQAVASGYVDAGVTGCTFGACFTIGVQFGLDQGLHPYAGDGFGTTGFTGAFNLYPDQSISEGLNCSGQVAVGGQFGASSELGFGGISSDMDGTSGSPFFGFGVYVGTGPGAAVMCYHVF